MKIIILLTVICIHAGATGYTQTISLSLNNAPLEQAFKEIKKQTGYSFVYTRSQLKNTKPVTCQIKDAALQQVLDICFLNQPLSYLLEDRYIVIQNKRLPIEIDAKPEVLEDLKGRVVNNNGEPIPGATVKIKASGIATACDEQGRFTLHNVTKDDELVVSSIGFETKEIFVAGQSFIIIPLSLSVTQLDQTVIIGYGKTTRRFSTGSVTKVTAEEISKQPVSNPLAALQGRVPGLTVTATSGLPGSSFNVQIRGQNSLKADPGFNTVPPIDQPLFIVDGVPLATQNNNLNQLNSIVAPGFNSFFNNSYGGISPFNEINPNEIESIEVLRDADATAIYGSRGANGVILITTKKGTSGKTTVNANVYAGESFVGHTMPMMTTQQYLQMRREAIKNDGNTPNLTLYNPGFAPDLLVYDTSRYTDWKKYFTGNNAQILDANVSLSGGSSNTLFRLGTGFHRETYVFPGDFNYNRGSFTSSLHHSTTNQKLILDFSANYTTDKNNSAGSPNLLVAYTLEPDYPDLYDDNGNLRWSYNGVTLGGSYGIANMNPLAYLQKKYSIKNNFLTSHFQIQYNFFHNLALRSSFGYSSIYTDEYSGNPSFSQNPDFTRTASADFGSTNQKSWIIEPQAEYHKLIKQSQITVLFGSTFQKDEKSSTRISASGYRNDALIGSISGAPNKTVSDAFSQYKYGALFGRLSYLFKQKYIFNLNARRDGSSRFGPGKQFGNFGSIGAGWIFSEENFIKKHNSWLSYGKLRASYGTTGNDNSISDYQYIARWAPTSYTYQGSQGYIPQNLYNPEFSWALTKKLEASVELGFLKNRLLMNATWYRDRSNNQLVFYQLPSQTGLAGVTENWAALVENKGLEFSLTTTNMRTSTFSWNTAFNLTIPKNRLVSFPGIETSSYAVRYVVGQPLSVLNKLRFTGVNDSTGLFQFITADGKITSTPKLLSGTNFNDMQIIGNLDPKFFGGLSNALSYKGIHIDVFIEFKKQLGLNYLAQIYGNRIPGFEYNQPAALLSRWQKPGDHTTIQKFTSTYAAAYAAGAQYFTQSSGVYSDASYLRFKTVSLSYDLPTKILSKVKMSACRFYVQAQNLFIISGYKGDDPETQNFYGIPPLKTITAGLQFNF